MGQQGNIVFGSLSSGGGGGIVVNGARNGTSIDSGGFVVLGEDQGDPDMPGKLISAREVPLNEFTINWFGGSTVFSTVAGNTPEAQLLEVQGVEAAGGDDKMVRFVGDSTAAGSAFTLLQLDALVPDPVGIATPGAYIQMSINGVQSFDMAYDGQTFWRNPVTGATYFAILDTQELLGSAGGQGIVTIQPTYNTAIPGIYTDAVFKPTFATTSSLASMVDILLEPIINQTGGANGSVTGILFSPGITSLGGQLIGYQNTIGDNLFQSNGAAGRNGFHGVVTPSAYIHIGAGAAAAGSAPLKFSIGVFQTVGEQGAVEYDGTDLTLVRSGTTREYFLTAITAAAPGTSTIVLPTSVYGTGASVLTTPTNWAQVNVGGTNFKIPLY